MIKSYKNYINESNEGDKLFILKSKLKPFGKVEVCEEVDGKFHIKITNGFSDNAMKTFELIKLVNELIGKKYPKIDKMVTDNNLFDCIFKP